MPQLHKNRNNQKLKSSFLLLLFLLFSFSRPLSAMMSSSHSGVFTSSKAVNELVKTHESFLYRFDTQSALRTFVGEMSIAKRVFGHYSLTAEIMSSFNKAYNYHDFELGLTRGFTDGDIYGLLSVSYRIGHYDKREQWLVISTGTGFIPNPYGVETSFAIYIPFTSDRYTRFRGELIGIYRSGSPERFFDFGLQASIYMIPSGEFGVPNASGYTRDNPLIEEFLQFEGGIMARFGFNKNIALRLLITNVIFINQTTYEDVDTSTKRGSSLSYAPKAMLGLIFKI